MIPRWVAIILIYAAFFFGVYLFMIAIVPQLYREMVRITGNAVTFARSLTPERVQEIARQAEDWLNSHGVPVALSSRALEGADAAEAYTGRPSFSLAVDLEQLLRRGLRPLLGNRPGERGPAGGHDPRPAHRGSHRRLHPLLHADGGGVHVHRRRGDPALLPLARSHRSGPPTSPGLVRRIDRSLAGVVRGQVTICLVNGILTFVGLVLFGVKFAFLLATVATVFSLIPIFGTILSSVPIVAMALAQSWKAGLGMLLWIIGIHALEAYFLNPKIMGSAARIHPVVVAFALIAGERTYGLLGALFAVPVAAVVVACFDFVRRKAQVVALPPSGLSQAEPAGTASENCRNR